MKIIIFYVSPSFPQLQIFFLLKTQKNNYSSPIGWWEYTKYRFKENAKIPLKKILQFQEKNVFFIKNTKTTSSASVW